DRVNETDSLIFGEVISKAPRQDGLSKGFGKSLLVIQWLNYHRLQLCLFLKYCHLLGLMNFHFVQDGY
ncbi:hypothetical protein, partial [Lysinibacillus fusiformis]|uniref:hypothetical protein n=1 Tax=Lysinibacillus fusiformis TaxID=28031 RepID=UPI0020C0C5C9